MDILKHEVFCHFREFSSRFGRSVSVFTSYNKIKKEANKSKIIRDMDLK